MRTWHGPSPFSRTSGGCFLCRGRSWSPCSLNVRFWVSILIPMLPTVGKRKVRIRREDGKAPDQPAPGGFSPLLPFSLLGVEHCKHEAIRDDHDGGWDTRHDRRGARFETKGAGDLQPLVGWRELRSVPAAGAALGIRARLDRDPKPERHARRERGVCLRSFRCYPEGGIRDRILEKPREAV